jgi:hypothetical protein
MTYRTTTTTGGGGIVDVAEAAAKPDSCAPAVSLLPIGWVDRSGSPVLGQVAVLYLRAEFALRSKYLLYKISDSDNSERATRPNGFVI